tara:strand:+ start:3740 stop:8719 length:4980 start_codon:yes stop_codon:yes gene_type:complete
MVDFTNKTFKEKYKDFYKAEDGYYRVLFNSGKALQARELNESQTIIQEEIARFGRNIFKEGALVNPGGATVDNKIEYIRLDASSIAVDATWVGTTLSTSIDANIQGLELEVLEVVEHATDPTTLYVKYTNTSSVTSLATAPRVTSQDTLYRKDNVALTALVADDSADPISASGRATKAYFAPGDFFAAGHFVYMEGGSSFISKYSSLPTADIGFRIVQNIITTDEDQELFDNQGEYPDVSAPGADRYQIKLVPTTRDQVLVDQNFVFVARVVDGVITREVSTFDSYNRINDLLAQRTKEESGNYVVEKFKSIFEEKDATNLNLDVTEGIAYVDGYRLEIGTTDITVPKARDTVAKENEAVPATYGNYVYIKYDETNVADNSEGFGRLGTFGAQYLKDINGTLIGYCNVRGVQYDSIGLRLYIFNIRLLNASFSLCHTMTNATPASTNAVIQLVDAVIHEASDNSLLFSLPRSTPVSAPITANYTVQRYLQTTADSNGNISIAGVEHAGWAISETDGPIVNMQPSLAGVYSGLTAGGSYEIAYYVELTNQPARTKTRTVKTKTQTLPTVDWRARPVVTLDVDGISLDSVYFRAASTTAWADAEDITYQFTFDGGQRDNFYDKIQANVKSGYELQTGTGCEIQVNYTHYTHGNLNAGTFFSVDSYVDDAYEDIPNYNTATGTVVSLRDVLDFRPARATGSYLNEFTVDAELPQNASTITINEISYYLPRIDVLVANATDSRGDIGFGQLQVIQGEANDVPRAPEIPTGSMALYNYYLKPYTFGTADVTSTFIHNKRFTMKDIGKLEQRVEDLFELTTLSLLENSTNSLTVLDASGNTRTKAGFIADNFSSFAFSDINNVDYRASIDPQGLLKPSFRENSVRLKYSADNVDAVVKHGDVVTLPYTDVNLVSQKLATGILNVNPFAVLTQTGHMELSPSSDEWVETRSLPAIMQTTVRRFEDFDTRPTMQGTTRDLFSNSGLFTTIPRDISFRATTRSVQDFIGEQVADIEIIPFMRSRKVNFTVKGLRPNTKMFAYFGGKDVSDWVREEATAARFSDTAQEFGSEYANALEYPTALGGKSPLESDSNGTIIGSFFLPNTPAINFRTGTQEFKLLDVNVNDESEATCSSRAVYSSIGTIETVQRTIRTTRILNGRAGRQDPLAQTFFVDQIENPNGMFITKARIFLESKDSNIPLQVQIRSVENGVPTTRILPGAVKFIEPAQVNVTAFDTSTTMAAVAANHTEVIFDEPIYLTSGEEYAIILLAESVEYNAYIAETYEFVVGSDEDKISRQPTLGSLFLSQNGFTWTPDQTKDLMFELDRAEFSASGELVLDNATLPKVTLGSNPIETTVGSNSVEISHEGHGFSFGDYVTLSNVANAVGGQASTVYEGTFQISLVTWEGYTIDIGSPATSSAIGGGDEVTATQQVVYNEFVPQVQTITPNGTNITAKLRNPNTFASYGTLRSSAPFVNYNLGAVGDATQVVLNDYNASTEQSVVASSDNAIGAETMKFNLSLSTSDSKVSPLIDLQRVAVLALENVIDNSDAAQHITTPVVIDDASLGLKVIFAANRPSGASFEVYVKSAADEDALLATDDDGLFTVDWDLVAIDKALPTDDDPSTYRDYEYTHEMNQFTAFQVKIVMQSDNSSKSPVIRDLRAIALVTAN